MGFNWRLGVYHKYNKQASLDEVKGKNVFYNDRKSWKSRLGIWGRKSGQGGLRERGVRKSWIGMGLEGQRENVVKPWDLPVSTEYRKWLTPSCTRLSPSWEYFKFRSRQWYKSFRTEASDRKSGYLRDRYRFRPQSSRMSRCKPPRFQNNPYYSSPVITEHITKIRAGKN